MLPQKRTWNKVGKLWLVDEQYRYVFNKYLYVLEKVPILLMVCRWLYCVSGRGGTLEGEGRPSSWIPASYAGLSSDEGQYCCGKISATLTFSKPFYPTGVAPGFSGYQWDRLSEQWWCLLVCLTTVSPLSSHVTLPRGLSGFTFLWWCSGKGLVLEPWGGKKPCEAGGGLNH